MVLGLFNSTEKNRYVKEHVTGHRDLWHHHALVTKYLTFVCSCVKKFSFSREFQVLL
jgi:hypothetical protein